MVKNTIMEKFWEYTIEQLIFICNKAGMQPNRLVVNNFTYHLIITEFMRENEYLQKNSYLGLKIHIDNDHQEQNKILIELDNKG